MSDHTPCLVVMDTSKRERARLKPVPTDALLLTEGFWAPRLRINRDVTTPSQHRRLEETGRPDSFCRAAGRLDQPFVGIYFKKQVSANRLPCPAPERLEV
jgi:hypothetical protein